MVIGPFFDDDQLFYAIGFAVSVIRPSVLIAIVNAVMAWVIAESLDTFLLPNLHMIRFTAFGQHPGLEVAFRYQTDAAAEACRPGIGERKNG